MLVKLRLTVDVEYETDNPDVEDYLLDRLAYLPFQAAGEGLLTGNADAMVERWSYTVENVT